MAFRVLGVCILAAFGIACSGPVTRGGSSRSDALTLDQGHRFLERIEQDRVILKRKVGTRTLPFSDDAFVGKNIVIHPSNTYSDDGIFARVTKVIPATDRITLVVRALQLDEVAQAARNGDDTLTIDRNPNLRELPSSISGIGSVTSTSGGGLSTQSLDLRLSPLAETDLSAGDAGGNTVEWPPVLGSSIGFTSNLTGSASATFRDTDFSFTPGLSAKWLDNGLELGAEMKLTAKFKADLKATATLGAPVYETVEDQKLLVLVKSGPVTLVEAPVLIAGVYTTIGVKASIACYARVEEKFSGTLDVDLGATLSGSAAIRLTKENEADSYIREGEIPFSADGHANASFTPEDITFTPSIFCEIPRVAVYVQPGGRIAEKLGGPNAYAALAGRFYASWNDEPSYKVQAVVGVSANPFGKAVGAEATLYTWRP